MDPSGQDDWLVPYDRGTDVTGAVLINAETGMIEQATWIDSGETPFLLSDLVGMYNGDYAGFVPTDNAAPEPGTIALSLVGMVFITARRRRQS